MHESRPGRLPSRADLAIAAHRTRRRTAVTLALIIITTGTSGCTATRKFLLAQAGVELPDDGPVDGLPPEPDACKAPPPPRDGSPPRAGGSPATPTTRTASASPAPTAPAPSGAASAQPSARETRSEARPERARPGSRTPAVPPAVQLTPEEEARVRVINQDMAERMRHGHLPGREYLADVGAESARIGVSRMLPEDMVPTGPSFGEDWIYIVSNAFAALSHGRAVLARIDQTFGPYRPLSTRTLTFRDEMLAPLRRDDPMVAVRDSAVLSEGQHPECDVYRSLKGLARDHRVGPQHPLFATRLAELADLYRMRGATREATDVLERALAIRERALGRDHGDVVATLAQLAGVLQEGGAYGRAEPLLNRALAIVRRTAGPASHEAIALQHRLALLVIDAGDSLRAATLLGQEVGALERMPDRREWLANGLDTLAELHRARRDPREAARALARAIDLRDALLDDELRGAPEMGRRATMALLRTQTDAIVSLGAEAPGHALELALTTVLRRKARTLDASVAARAAMFASITPRIREQLDQLDTARTVIMRTTLESLRQVGGGTERHQADPGSETPDEQRRRINDSIEQVRRYTRAQADAIRLEEDLERQAAAGQSPQPAIAIRDVQARLPEDAALVEFVRYRRFDPREIRQPWRESRYIAYLLTAHAAPESVPLGDAASLDAAVDGLLATLRSGTPIEAARAAAAALHARLLAPVRDHLPAVRHLIVAPDGRLNLVPFDALIDARGRPVIEDLLVTYVTTGRDLLAGEPSPPKGRPLLLAAPSYGQVAADWVLPAFPELPGALDEARALRGYLAEPIVGARATRAALRAAARPALIHIATHGFGFDAAQSGSSSTANTGEDTQRGMIFPDRPSQSLQDSRASAALTAARYYVDEAWGMDFAGLALADANRSFDGLIFAREIAAFDWRGTRLVVLSACGTGVGTTPSGDAVYGLRRAVTLAGAESQVVSLWPVGDQATPPLMRALYAELARGTGRGEALRRAKLALMHSRGRDHPYFWAPFILAGNWRPLEPGILPSHR